MGMFLMRLVGPSGTRHVGHVRIWNYVTTIIV